MCCYKEFFEKDITIALAHEVKNPVSLIKANIELLELDSALNAYQKNVSMMKNELNKITNIVSDFMLLCNPYNENSTKNIDVFNVIAEYIEKFDVYENITFSFNCFTSIEEVKMLTGKTRLSFVLSNVYKNCIEAIKHKNGIIKTNLYKENDNLVIEIIDNGEGIDNNLLEKIYEPFFTSKESGTGLGIPICVNIMKSLNGSFTIYNNPDKIGCTTKLIFSK